MLAPVKSFQRNGCLLHLPKLAIIRIDNRQIIKLSIELSYSLLFFFLCEINMKSRVYLLQYKRKINSLFSTFFIVCLFLIIRTTLFASQIIEILLLRKKYYVYVSVNLFEYKKKKKLNLNKKSEEENWYYRKQRNSHYIGNSPQKLHLISLHH